MLSKQASQANDPDAKSIADPTANLRQTGILDSLGDLLEDVLKSSGVLGKKNVPAPSQSRSKAPPRTSPEKPAGKPSKTKKPAEAEPDEAPPQDRASKADGATSSVVTAKTLSSALYFYQAIVREVYDGDTITVDIDLGMHNWVHGEKLRLLRINAPEYKGESHAAGEKARDFLRNLVLDKSIVIETFKDDQEKYGRYLAELWVEDPKNKDKYINVNDLMVKSGNAKYQQY